MNVVDATFGLGAARIAVAWVKDRGTQVVVKARISFAGPRERDRLQRVAEDAAVEYDRIWFAAMWTRTHQPAPARFHDRLRAPGLPDDAALKNTLLDGLRACSVKGGQ